jgi:hypothetical protein
MRSEFHTMAADYFRPLADVQAANHFFDKSGQLNDRFWPEAASRDRYPGNPPHGLIPPTLSGFLAESLPPF